MITWGGAGSRFAPDRYGAITPGQHGGGGNPGDGGDRDVSPGQGGVGGPGPGAYIGLR